jgi:hypothetical protein
MKLFKKSPKFKADGKLNVLSIKKLSFDEISVWIKDALEFYIPFHLDNVSDQPFIFLSKTYHELDIRSRQLFEDAILSHLNNISFLNPSWSGDAGDELLLLTSLIFRAKHLREKPIGSLFRIINNPMFNDINGFNLRKRAFQTLLELEYLAPVVFWQSLFEIEGDDYAGIVIGGLLHQDILVTIEWIQSHINHKKIFDAFLDYIPWIIEHFPVNQFEQKLFGLSLKLRAQDRETLNQYLITLGVDINLNVIDQLESLFIDDELEDILKSLDVEFHANSPKKDLLQLLMKQVYTSIPPYKPDENLLYSTRILLGFIELIGKKGLAFSVTPIYGFLNELPVRYKDVITSDPSQLFFLEQALYSILFHSDTPELDFIRFGSYGKNSIN